MRRRVSAEYVLLALLLAVGIWLRVTGFDALLPRSPDERNLAAEAREVVAMGPAAIQNIVAEIHADPILWGEPSPLRAGYLFLLAGLMQASGDGTELVGAWLSVASSVGCLLLVAWMGWKFLSKEAALVAVMFAAVSPLELVLARRAWQDAFVELLALELLAIAMQAVVDRGRRVWWLGALAVAGAYGVTVKEINALVFGFCVVVVGAVLVKEKDWRGLAWLAGSCAVATGLACWWLAHLFGGMQTALAFETEWLQRSTAGSYSAEYETGPGWMYFAALLRLAPVVVVAAWVGIGVLAWGFAKRQKDEVKAPLMAAALVCFCAVFFTLPVLAERRMNFRYASVAFGALDLLTGVGVAWAIKPLRRALAPLGTVAATVVLLFAIGVAGYRDWVFFATRMQARDVEDLSIRMVRAIESGNSRMVF